MEEAAAKPAQASPCRLAILASMEGMPASAVTRKAPKKTIAALSPLPRICTAAQMAKAQSMGWRVTRWMPCGPRESSFAPPIAVGLPMSEQANSTKAGSIATASTIRSQPGANQSGVVCAPCHACASSAMDPTEATEKAMVKPASPSLSTTRPRSAVPEMPTWTKTQSRAARMSRVMPPVSARRARAVQRYGRQAR